MALVDSRSLIINLSKPMVGASSHPLTLGKTAGPLRTQMVGDPTHIAVDATFRQNMVLLAGRHVHRCRFSDNPEIDSYAAAIRRGQANSTLWLPSDRRKAATKARHMNQAGRAGQTYELPD